jgi:hypothetical protein
VAVVTRHDTPTEGQRRAAARATWVALGALAPALLALALTATPAARDRSPGAIVFDGVLGVLARLLGVLSFLASGWGLLAVRLRSVSLIVVNILALAVVLSLGPCW